MLATSGLNLDRVPDSPYRAPRFGLRVCPTAGFGFGAPGMMTEKPPPPSLDDLDARLGKARAKQKGNGDHGNTESAAKVPGVGFAFRIGVDLVAALAVGVGIGWLLDRLLGTGPWLMVVFFFLGAGAGIMSVYRTANKIGQAVGYGDRKDSAGEEDRTPDRREEDK